MMSKKIHPARRARNLTGAVSALALVGMVTSFQLAAAAKETTNDVPSAVPAAATSESPATQAQQKPAETAPAPAPAQQAPAEQAPAEPAPAPVVPAPAPAAPSGTTGGS
jgi:hypothetical protein